MTRPVRLSVVFATYEREMLAERLIEQLDRQTLPPESYEVIVVDDGSADGIAGRLAQIPVRYALTVLRQPNSGASAARRRGMAQARGEVVVVVDDDMQVPPTFLEAHLARHLPGVRRAVLGQIRPDPGVARMPLFERYHAFMLERWVDAVRQGRSRVEGTALCTGNVSFQRSDYEAVGGFDASLRRSEDAELGVRLQKAGVELVFAEDAFTLHGSDHQSLAVWMHRAFLYGVNDLRIARKHPDAPWVSPWRFLFLVSPLSRPLLLATLLTPSLGRALARIAMVAARAVDRLGAERVAIAGATLVYGLLYFSGVRQEEGTFGATMRDLVDHVRGRSEAATQAAQARVAAGA